MSDQPWTILLDSELPEEVVKDLFNQLDVAIEKAYNEMLQFSNQVDSQIRRLTSTPSELEWSLLAAAEQKSISAMNQKQHLIQIREAIRDKFLFLQ